MRVLVCTMPSKKNYMRIGRCGGSMKVGERWPPIKLMFAAAVARKHSDVKFIDAANLSMDKAQLLSEVEKFSPNLIITEPTLPSLEHEIDVINDAKNICDGKVALIGAFAINQSKQIFDKSNIDYIVQGEAEGVIQDIVKGKKLSSIKGLWYRSGKSVKFTGHRGFTKNLDTLPFPAHDLLRLDAYTSFFIKKKPFTLTESSRGCPHSCTFCNAWLMNGKIPRFRSIESMIRELKWIKSLGIKSVFFIEETFTLDPVRLRKLLNKMIEDKLDLEWMCTTRADVVDKPLLALMKMAGCHTIFFGVESGNQEILDYYNKGVTLEQMEKAFKNCRDVGITTLAQLMVGAPQESFETVKNTVNFVVKLKADYISVNFLTPYVGTAVEKNLMERGLIKEDGLSFADQSSSSALRTEYMSSDDLEKSMKYIYKRFYLRPSYILDRLKSIRSFSDLTKIVKVLMSSGTLLK